MHFESAALETVENLLESSGWTGAVVQACVPTFGKADSFLKAAHITRTRRAHQVTACVLQLAWKRHTKNMWKQPNPTPNPWVWKTGAQFNRKANQCSLFWFLVLQLQLTILVFVRSIRSGNFPLYIQSLTKLVHWFFKFDHYHYARWILVHLRDMMALSHFHPDIHTEFVKGHFTVKKTSNAFSNLAIDQAHEQNNAVVKDDRQTDRQTELFIRSVK